MQEFTAAMARKRSLLAISFAAMVPTVIFGLLAVFFFFRASSLEQANALEGKSIAVLPFENRSELPEDRFFSDGFHDDLLTQISHIDDIKTISRTSVMAYRDTTKNMRETSAHIIIEQLAEADLLEKRGQAVLERFRLLYPGYFENGPDLSLPFNGDFFQTLTSQFYIVLAYLGLGDENRGTGQLEDLAETLNERYPARYLSEVANGLLLGPAEKRRYIERNLENAWKGDLKELYFSDVLDSDPAKAYRERRRHWQADMLTRLEQIETDIGLARLPGEIPAG